MKNLLLINTSLFASAGYSSQLTEQFVSRWLDHHTGAHVIRRDVVAQPLPHLTAEHVSAFSTPADQRTPTQQAITAQSDTLIDELKQCELLVIGLPLYNFGIPSTLKAYFDHIARAGITFRYTPQGAEGLLHDKKAYIFATRGGIYAGTPLDTQTQYIRHFLAFIGITEVEFIYAEGLNISEAHKTHALQNATATLTELACIA